MARTITRRYDPTQPRGADGRWGGFNMADFTNGLVEIEGTFGRLAMGADDTGDVRLAFREDGEARELDLGAEELADLSGALTELADARDDLPDDADQRGVYDDAYFGYDSAHKAELYGSGVIAVTFGVDDDDPWTLTLDPPDGDDDDTAAFLDAIDDVLQGGPVERAAIERKFNPDQLRIPGGADGGQWATAGGPSDALRLEGRIDLAPGESLVGSGRVDGNSGAIRVALTEQHGQRSLRLGIGNVSFGSREDEAGPWRGGSGQAAQLNAERQKLREERSALQGEWDRLDAADADPARRAVIEERLNEIEELDSGDVFPSGYTSNIDAPTVGRLATILSAALDEGAIAQKADDDYWAEHDALEAKLNKLRHMDRKWTDEEDARWDALSEQLEALEATAPSSEYKVFAEGSIPGEWGDVHYRVDFEDPSVGVQVTLGATPAGTSFEDVEGSDQAAILDAAETRKLLRLLDKMAPTAERARSPENGDKASAPAGGQFAAGGGRVGGKGRKPPARRRGPGKPAAPAGPMKFDGKSGTGYGIKGGDPKVRTLQAALTRLGITDSDGKALAPDGKYGPKTTSAVKKLQAALGLKADGQVTPELLKQVTELKQLPPAAKPRSARRRPTSTRRSLLATVNRALRLGVEVRHPLLFDRTFALDDIQISRSGDGRTVEAYAAMFNAPYEVQDQHGHYMEVIDRAAFNRTLSNGAGKTALCLYNHGMSVVDGKTDSLAQVPLGTPVEIKADGRGLLTVTRYNKSALADSVLEAIRNGDIRSQSFRGRIIRSSPDRLPARNRAGGLPTITRHELGLADYGPTPIPVNAGAEIMAVRSKLELIQDFAALPDDDRLDVLRTLGIDPDGDDIEETQGEASVQDDDTPTSTVELGTQDSPQVRHSGGQSEIARRSRAARTARRMLDEATH